jgi:hypothetical protein
VEAPSNPPRHLTVGGMTMSANGKSILEGTRPETVPTEEVAA